MKRMTLKASIMTTAMLAMLGAAAEETYKPGTIVWSLSVTTATPGRFVEPDFVAGSDWATERDCKQAEKLEQEIGLLKNAPVATKCRKAEVLENYEFTKWKGVRKGPDL